MHGKIFMQRGKFVLWGDEKHIMVPANQYMQVVHWCKQNGIEASVDNKSFWTEKIFNVVLWKVVDDRQRLLFSLKWS